MRLVPALLIAACAWAPHTLANEREDLVVTATPVSMTRDGLEERRGQLHFLGGFELSSTDSRFGGISSLRFIGESDTLLALTDRGVWLSLEARFEEGQLVGVKGGFIMPTLGSDGAPLEIPNSDSESMVIHGDQVFVGYEGTHRVDRFDAPWGNSDARARAYLTERDLWDMSINGGLEGLTRLGDGRLLMGAEEPDATGNLLLALLSPPLTTRADLWLERDSPFKLTDLATMPNGHVLTLERRFSIFGGVGAQIRLIQASDLVPGATVSARRIAAFGPGDTVDNMEGLAVRDHEGVLQVLIISDDNFNSLQRTLLMAFELALD